MVVNSAYNTLCRWFDYEEESLLPSIDLHEFVNISNLLLIGFLALSPLLLVMSPYLLPLIALGFAYDRYDETIESIIMTLLEPLARGSQWVRHLFCRIYPSDFALDLNDAFRDLEITTYSNDHNEELCMNEDFDELGELHESESSPHTTHPLSSATEDDIFEQQSIRRRRR